MWGGWVHHSWRFRHAEALHKVDPKMPEHGSKTSTVPVVWATLEFFQHDPNDFLSRLVTMDEAWLYHYDPETKQQSMKWWHSGSPRRKKSAGKVLTLIFWDQEQHPPHWLSSKGPNYQCRVLLISAGAIEGHFEGKIPREGHQGGLVLAWQCPGSPGTCNPEENGLPGFPVSWSPALFCTSGLIGLPFVAWTEKINWKIAIFCPVRRSLLPWRPGWMDNLLNSFWVVCKS